MQFTSSHLTNLFSFCKLEQQNQQCYQTAQAHQLHLDIGALIAVGRQAENAFHIQTSILQHTKKITDVRTKPEQRSKACLEQVVLHLDEHGRDARFVARHAHALHLLRRQTKLQERN